MVVRLASKSRLLRSLLLIICVFVVQCLVRHPSNMEPIQMVSIIDSSSTLSCLLKIHTIIESSHNPRHIIFKFLVVNSGPIELSVEQWNKTFNKMFPSSQSETKLWVRPDALHCITGEHFDKEIVYARFYLPFIFPESRRLLYLDNDIVVNDDLLQLFQSNMENTGVVAPIHPERDPSIHMLSLSSSVSSKQSRGTIRNSNVRNSVYGKAHSIHRSTVATSHNPRTRNATAPIAFVYETHPFYATYKRNHFNGSHALVQDATRHTDKNAFLNAGVFLMDTIKWRQLNLTQRAEELIIQNCDGSVYGLRIGDQGLFFVMLHNNTAYLPARYNMRRLPKKTMSLLEEQQLGIIHFAGTTGGDAELLCRNPLQYPMLLPSATPLYLSMVASYMNKLCRNRGTTINGTTIGHTCDYLFTDVCLTAVRTVSEELRSKDVRVRYNPGRGVFPWPPRPYVPYKAITDRK